jgi:hypothetical protein
VATYSRVRARLKTQNDAAASQKGHFPPSAEQYRSFRRAPAQPRPAAGIARWVRIMSGSEARGWWSGAQPPSAGKEKGGGSDRSAGVRTGVMGDASPHLAWADVVHSTAQSLMKPTLCLDPRRRGAIPSYAAAKPRPRSTAVRTPQQRRDGRFSRGEGGLLAKARPSRRPGLADRRVHHARGAWHGRRVRSRRWVRRGAQGLRVRTNHPDERRNNTPTAHLVPGVCVSARGARPADTIRVARTRRRGSAPPATPVWTRSRTPPPRRRPPPQTPGPRPVLGGFDGELDAPRLP